MEVRLMQSDDTLEIHTLFRTLAKKVTEEWNKQTDNAVIFSQFRMLYILNTQGRQRVAELADHLQVTAGAITGMSDRMIDRGLVERKRDEVDRRVVFLLISDQGKTFLETLIKKQRLFYDRIFEQMASEDIQHLKRILSQMIHLVDTID